MCCRAGLPSAPCEAQDKPGALFRGWLQGVNVGVQAGVPSAVLASRVPAAQGLCAGAGTLPPARLSTQPAWDLPTALEGSWRGGTSPVREGKLFLCSGEGAVWVRAAQSFTSL